MTAKTAQFAHAVMMVRPASFGFNPQTAADNHYQRQLTGVSAAQSARQAVVEFDAMVTELRANNIRVVVIEDTPEPVTADAVFPNNWISLHADGSVVMYPMLAPIRRLERRDDVLDQLREEGFVVADLVNLTAGESREEFLEGTGVLVLDHEARLAYCAISKRADEGLLKQWCERFGYRPVAFVARQTAAGSRQPIYHTNVMMSVADQFVVICLDAIDDAEQRAEVVAAVNHSGKTLVEITEQQVEQFAGNCLQVGTRDGKPVLVLSQSAHDALTHDQRHTIEQFCPLLPVSIPTIETLGGGSARCMLAEIFLPLAIDESIT